MAGGHALVTAIVPVGPVVTPGVLPITIDEAVSLGTDADRRSILPDPDGDLRVRRPGCERQDHKACQCRNDIYKSFHNILQIYVDVKHASASIVPLLIRIGQIILRRKLPTTTGAGSRFRPTALSSNASDFARTSI
jgi:hypothetical protein